MSNIAVPKSSAGGNRSGFFLLIACLVATLSFLFVASFDFKQALFANDGPYGGQMALYLRPPTSFFGIWNDLYWLGAYNGNYFPNFTGTLLFALGPRVFINFYAPTTALILGLCAWVFFRQLRLQPWVSVLGGVAAALNMNFFSNACWGLGTRNTSLACIFLALALVQSSFRRLGWIKYILAGLAIGVSISEGGDNGAIFAIFVAGYAFFLSLTQPGSMGLNVAKGAARVLVMAVFAAVMAAQTLSIFVNTAVKGVVAVQRSEMSPQQKWDWATQWSLPKLETLRVIIPGIHGYRLDTPEGGNYWGSVGQQPGWSPQNPVGFPRHSGAGEYAGVLVVLVALWAVASACSKKSSAYDPQERRVIQFWGLMALIALLLSWGRHAPFYRLVYMLPYFSTIRNPMKFMHPFHMTLMILFAYGLAGMARRYLEKAGSGQSLGAHLAGWWGKATGFERLWNWGCVAALALSVVGYLAYSNSRGALAQYLTTVGFNDARLSMEIARFSVKEVGLFVLFLTASMGVLAMIQSGAFAGARYRWAGILLGTILIIDLVRADTPWIQYFTIEEKYATNPVLDKLREKPWNHRVTVPNFNLSGQPQSAQQYHAMLQQVYHIEWLQHHFQLYNIPALEVAQMPRVPEDFEAFNKALIGQQLRMWQLCNTRYIMALSGFADAFNAQMDPEKKRFRNALLFEIGQRPGGGVIAVTNTTGPLSLIEFTGALPRAKLYAQWQVSTNDEAALKRLAEPSFDPETSVLVKESIPASTTASNAALAPVEFTSYSSRKIDFSVDAAVAAVLLVNNRYDANWKVSIDGKPAELLRCNFIMQGVQVPPGKHTVTFLFAPPANGFWLMLGCVIFGLVLCGVVFVAERFKKDQPK